LHKRRDESRRGTHEWRTATNTHPSIRTKNQTLMSCSLLWQPVRLPHEKNSTAIVPLLFALHAQNISQDRLLLREKKIWAWSLQLWRRANGRRNTTVIVAST